MCATPVAYGGKPHNSLFQTRFGDEPCRAAQESHDFNRGRCQIGYCADEERRFNKRLSAKKLEIYPLAENGINEDVILEWAKTQPIFNNYYKTNKRCGCMYCPMSSYLNFAYLYKYYPENFRYMLEKMRETEELREKELGRPFSVISSNPKYNADYLEHIVKTKWLKKLNEMECTTKQKNIAAAKNQIEIGG